MTSTSTSRTDGKASQHLTSVTPSQVAAMRDLDTDTLRALITATAAAASGHGQDVTEHAVLIAASTYAGTPGEGYPRTAHAARKAVRMAVRTVALAERHQRALADSVAAGMAERTSGVVLPGALTSTDTSPADTAARITYGDLVATALGMAASPDLDALAAAYMAHARDCQPCRDAATSGKPGQRPTLTGVTAHLAGLSPRTDSTAYKGHQRAAQRALGHGLTMADLFAAIGDTSPMATRPTSPSTLAERTPVTRPDPAIVGRVTVTRADGTSTSRTLTAAEQSAVDSPSAPTADSPAAAAARADRDAAQQDDGTRCHAPHADSRTRGGLPAPARPRKGARGGQTGPTVTGSPRALGMTGTR